jgi:hypothetical protein
VSLPLFNRAECLCIASVRLCRLVSCAHLHARCTCSHRGGCAGKHACCSMPMQDHPLIRSCSCGAWLSVTLLSDLALPSFTASICLTLIVPSFTPSLVHRQVLELLGHHLAQWSCSPALPELAHLPVLQLRRFAKLTRVDRFRRAAKSLLEVIDR